MSDINPGIGLLYIELVKGVPAIFGHFLTTLPAIHSMMCLKVKGFCSDGFAQRAITYSAALLARILVLIYYSVLLVGPEVVCVGSRSEASGIAKVGAKLVMAVSNAKVKTPLFLYVHLIMFLLLYIRNVKWSGLGQACQASPSLDLYTVKSWRDI
ncbi:hypothetical protein NE237_004273 [Protea cynaroides]|uniref:Uncharacterized protein n=1 Tax=Protea cynaroides TaxID=273540 RepID=A0A9Q0QTI8_9MAGN|nr:hypothetical protein NE237_004273 [Protea cynaroides]